MAWLVRGERVLASLEVANGFLARNRGLIGRSAIEGAMLLPHTNGVHTVGVRFPIDVAWLDKNLVVLRTVRLRRFRVAVPRRRAKYMLEAEAGAFERWTLQVGDALEIKE